MSVRTGSLIAALVIALGAALYLVLESGNPSSGGTALERETSEGDAVLAADLEGSTELDAPSAPADEAGDAKRAAAVTPEAPQASLSEPSASSDVDRSTVAVLSGYIRDEQGGPVVGARVIAARNALELMAVDSLAMMDPGLSGRMKETATDERGFFEIVGITPGQPGLRVFATGFVPQSKTDVLIAAREHLELPNPIVLDTSAILTGVVLDESSAPVEGARVSASKKQSGVMSMATSFMTDKGVKTAADGSFRLDMLDVAELEVTVTHAAFSNSKTVVDTREGGELAALEIRLARDASIHGRVSGWTGDGARSLQVVALPGDLNMLQGMQIRTCEVAQDGLFELSGMKEGSQWKVFAREHDGEEINMMLMWNDAGLATERIEAVAGSEFVELEYIPASTVSFQVVDATTGSPITRLKISSGSLGPMAASDTQTYAEGRVLLEALRPTEGTTDILVTVDAVGYTQRRETVDASGGREIDGGVWELTPAPLAQFLTIDALTREPVEGVSVSLVKQKQEADSSQENDGLMGLASNYRGKKSGTSDADGIAQVETHLEGTFDVTARSDRYGTLRLSGIQILDSDVTPVPLELRKGATVKVSAKDVFGFALPARTIEHLAPGGGRRMPWADDGTDRVTDTTGVATFENLEPGTHGFRIAKLASTGEQNMMTLLMAMERGDEEDDDSWTSVEVGGTDVKSLELVELPTGSLTGHVSELGKPLRRAELRLRKAVLEEESDEDVDAAEAMLRKMSMEMTGQGAPSVKTDREGNYTFESVEVGEYVLEIDYRKRAMRAEYSITIVAGDQVQDFDLEVAILAGKVLDGNGDGVKGALVSVRPYLEPAERGEGEDKADMARGLMGEIFGVEGKFRTFKTKRNGSFELRGVTPDVPLVVHVDGSEAGFQNATSEPLELRPNGSREDLELTVQQGGTLDVTVLKADGSATEFVLVRIERTDGSIQPMNEVAVGGIKEVTGLTPGTYRVAADDNPDEDALFGDGDASTIGKVDTTIEIVGGETTTIELRLPE